MDNTCVTTGENEYYTAAQAAKILGLKKSTVQTRCQKGQFPGAYKAAGTEGNPNGCWMIPASAVGVSVATEEVVVMQQPVTPARLEQMLRGAVGAAVDQAVVSAVAPLNAQIEQQRAEIGGLREDVQSLQKVIESRTVVARIGGGDSDGGGLNWTLIIGMIVGGLVLCWWIVHR